MNTKSWQGISRGARAWGATVLVGALVLGAGTVALAAGGRGTSTTVLASVRQITRTYAQGPEVMEERGPMDAIGGVGGVDPLPVTVPRDASAYDALVTVTFRYRTTGHGPFWVDLFAGIRERGPGLTTRPSTPWPLAPTAAVESSSVQFVVPALKAAQTYYFAPTAGTRLPRASGTNRLSTNNVVLTVQLTPRAAR
ncbi:hypothetical protein [Kineosporia succinea]|uniref:SbsA Ig-like domain-containing protein n=1 Tax=Kineosporia succinea TaxID=84632 RepID=A0ABT9PAV3_9ACTN|nr:hypothetical protein [Kineosporia succinea]MDP9829823.1 hypothetical protein [Kineosporia succinea]